MIPLFFELSAWELGTLCSAGLSCSAVAHGFFRGVDVSKLERKRILLSLPLIALVILGGCSSLTPPREDTVTIGGINPRYLFGDRRTVGETTESLVSDSEYAEYLAWKRWQDFQAYQEWRRLREREIEEN